MDSAPSLRIALAVLSARGLRTPHSLPRPAHWQPRRTEDADLVETSVISEDIPMSIVNGTPAIAQMSALAGAAIMANQLRAQKVRRPRRQRLHGVQ